MYRKAIKEVAEELGIPEEVAKAAYESYWVFIRESIKELPIKEDLTEEEFSKLRTNFNVPSLGKLSCTYKRYQGMRKRYEFLKALKDK